MRTTTTDSTTAMLDVHKSVEEHLALLETLFQHAPVGYAFVDRDFRYVRVNEALANIHAWPPGSQIGKTVQEVVPHLWPTLEPLYRRALAGETTLNHDISGLTSAEESKDRHWLVSYYPVRLQDEVIGIGIIVNDITERKQVEHALAIRNDLYAMLSQTNQAVNRCRTAEELYREICSIAVETGHFRFAWIGVPDGNQIKLVASAGNDDGYMNEIVITLDENDPRSHGPTGRSAVTGRPFVVNDFMASAMTAPWHAVARKVGVAASAAFPFKERGEVVATFTLYAGVPGFFTEDLVATLSEIMPCVSYALDAFAQERERKREVTEHQESEARFRAIFARAAIGIALVDMHGHPVVSNLALEEMLGYSMEELRDMAFTEFTHSDDVELDWNLYRELMAGTRESYQIEKRYIHKRGHVVWGRLTVSLVRDASGIPLFAIGMAENITERKLAEQNLQDSLQQLKTLTSHLQSVREEERTRIAREVHDELGQALTGLKIEMALLKGQIEPSENALTRALLQEKLDSMNALVEQTIKSVRRIITELRPIILDTLGLVPVLEWQAQDFQNRTGIKCRFSSELDAVPLDPERTTAVFRIVQESLTNVLRHARASRVHIHLEQGKGMLVLTVKDNGLGIKETDLRTTRSFGLLGMRERALLLDGNVEIFGAPKKGTTIVLKIPIDAHTDASIPPFPIQADL